MSVSELSGLEIAIEIAAEGWRALGDDVEALVADAVRAALASGNPALASALDEARVCGEVSVLLANDETVRILNRDYRDRDRATNVLSFPGVEIEPGATDVEGMIADLPPGQPLLLGDIALALETVRREAAKQGKDVRAHMVHLVVHGTLHLLGYDHIEDDDAEVMEGLEVTVLAGLGIANPYEDPNISAEAPGAP